LECRIDAGHLSRSKDDVFGLDGPEAALLKLNLVAAGFEIEDRIVAVSVRYRLAPVTCAGVEHSDLGAFDQPRGRIGDRAANLSKDRLRAGVRHAKKEKQQYASVGHLLILWEAWRVHSRHWICTENDESINKRLRSLSLS